MQLMLMPLLTLVIAISSLTISAQYHFVGIYYPSNAKDFNCRNGVMEEKSVKSASEYDEVRKNFLNTQKGNLPEAHFLSPKSVKIFFEINQVIPGSNCERKVITVAEGRDSAAAKEAMLKKVAANKEFRGNPKIIYKWGDQSKTPKKLESNINGLQVTYTYASENSYQKLSVQMRNTHANYATVVNVYENEILKETFTIEPKGTANRGYSMPEGLDLEVQLKVPSDNPAETTMEKTLKAVRESIIIKDGKPQKAPSKDGAAGQRG